MIEIQAPNKVPYTKEMKIFLAGTIDMGNSDNWQKKVLSRLEDSAFKDWIVLNPRRDDWDSSWIQHRDNPQFREQVEWELDAMGKSDLILFNFLPDSKSPITLLELGINSFIKPVIVICPDEYYRSGNVHIVCERYGIPYYQTLEDWFKTFN